MWCTRSDKRCLILSTSFFGKHGGDILLLMRRRSIPFITGSIFWKVVPGLFFHFWHFSASSKTEILRWSCVTVLRSSPLGCPTSAKPTCRRPGLSGSSCLIWSPCFYWGERSCHAITAQQNCSEQDASLPLVECVVHVDCVHILSILAIVALFVDLRDPYNESCWITEMEYSGWWIYR